MTISPVSVKRLGSASVVSLFKARFATKKEGNLNGIAVVDIGAIEK